MPPLAIACRHSFRDKQLLCSAINSWAHLTDIHEFGDRHRWCRILELFPLPLPAGNRLNHLNHLIKPAIWQHLLMLFWQMFLKTRFFPMGWKSHLNPLPMSFPFFPHCSSSFCSFCSLERQRHLLMVNKNQNEQPVVMYFSEIEQQQQQQQNSIFSLKNCFCLK